MQIIITIKKLRVIIMEPGIKSEEQKRLETLDKVAK